MSICAKNGGKLFTYLFTSLGAVTEIPVTLSMKRMIATTYMKTVERMSRIALGLTASASAADLDNSRIHFAITHRDNYVNGKLTQQSSCPQHNNKPLVAREHIGTSDGLVPVNSVDNLLHRER